MLYLKQNKLFLVERSTAKVSGLWKILHVTLFFAIAANFFLNSIIVGRIFKSFQYNCVLFCTNITFVQENLPLDAFSEERFQKSGSDKIDTSGESEIKNHLETEAERDINTVATERRLLSFENDKSIQPLGETSSDIEKANTNKPTVEKLNHDKRQDKTINDKPEAENDTVIFKNSSVYIYKNEIETIVVRSTLNLAKSRFPSGFLCNLTLSSVLGTFVWGLFFGVMMTMCSRGGKGYMNDILSRPQNYLYWIVLTSAMFEILIFVVLSIFERGMATFCAEFETFSDTKECSSALNHFTKQFNKNNESMNFYLWYQTATYTFYIGLGLIGVQILITILRILCLVDYQLYEVQLEDKSQTETMREISRQNSLNVDTTTEEFGSTMS